MAKKNLGEQLLGKVEVSSVKRAVLGAFLGFFVYAGAVFTFEPLFAATMGSESVFLLAAEDGDMSEAQRAAQDIQRQNDQAKRDRDARAAYDRHREKVDRQNSEWNKKRDALPVYDNKGNCIKNCSIPKKKT